MGYQYRTREDEIAKAVDKYLYDAGGEASIGQIRRALPHYIELTEVDRSPSPTRDGEEIWEQQVRNIVCHRTSVGNFVREGRFIYKPRMLKLADSPQQELFS